MTHAMIRTLATGMTALALAAPVVLHTRLEASQTSTSAVARDRPGPRRRRGRRHRIRAASAIACFMDDFDACIAHRRMPIPHRRSIRKTNLLERLFVEERRRLKIFPNAFGEKPVLKLMFGAMIRAAERWRAIKVTDFERRQMADIRQELDHE